jgi:hypothetical protein
MQEFSAFRHLPTEDQDLILMSLKAAISNVYFQDAELHAAFGVDRENIEAVIAQYPNISDSDDLEDEDACFAINGSLNFFSSMPNWGGAYDKMFSVPQKRLREVYRKWRALRGYKDDDESADS